MKTNEVGVVLDKNGYAPSIVDPWVDFDQRCFMCNYRGDLARHEIFNASNRQKSKAYGLWVYLCPRCHMKVHEYPDLQLKKIAQWDAMAHYGWTIDDFRERFGKNYVEV